MPEAVEMSPRTRQMLDVARSVCSRWGVTVPDNPEDPMKEMRIALRRSMNAALKQPFTPVYADDHGWKAMGMPGLSIGRLKEDDSSSGLSSASEEWGVVVLVEGYDDMLVIPIAYDLDQPLAESLAETVREDEGRFVDLEEVAPVLRRGSEETPDSEILVSVMASNWSDIRDLSQNSPLPLSEAVFFRRPVVWDLLRARISDASCPPLPAFDEKDFERRYFRSVRFDRRSSDATRELITSLSDKTVDLDTPSGIKWFGVVVDCLNSLGTGRAIEGLSVILHVEVSHRADPGESDHLPLEMMRWKLSSVKNVCIACGLDPVQASYLEDIVRDDAEAFHSLESDKDRYHMPIGVSVIPDIHLCGFQATVSGRDAGTYDALMRATSKSG